jgi:actin-related protein
MEQQRKRAEYYRQYYEKNKERKLARQKIRGKEYREENKEKLQAKSKEYYEKNKEAIREKTSKRKAEQYRDNPEQSLAKQKEWKINNPERYLLQGAKARAKKQGIPFDITYQDIIIPEFCPYLGCKLEMFSEWSSPSLDKKVPSLGYVKGNIQVISTKANTMKNNATQDELIAFANAVLKLHTGSKAASAALVEVFLEEL